MDTKHLKIMAGTIVIESKLSKAAKLQMINFLEKEATDAQVKALLMDGKIVALDEQAEEIVNARFKNHSLNEGVFKTLFGMFLLSPGGWVAYRAIRAAISEKSRRCGAFGIGKVRDICLAKVKALDATKMAGLISREMKNCAQAKNPAKCKAAGQKKIASLQAQAAKYNKKIQSAAKSPKDKLKTDMASKKSF